MPDHNTQASEPSNTSANTPTSSDRFGAPKKNKGAQDRSVLRKWRDHVEELLNEARDRGDFDNLQGAGKPLNLEKNVFAGDKAMAYSMLKNNNVAPPEIERGKEIDADLARANDLLVVLRRRRDSLNAKRATAFASERRAYNLLRDNTETRYTEALRSINSKILSLNIVAPPLLHRRMLDVEKRLSEFRADFPRLPD